VSFTRGSGHCWRVPSADYPSDDVLTLLCFLTRTSYPFVREQPVLDLLPARDTDVKASKSSTEDPPSFQKLGGEAWCRPGGVLRFLWWNDSFPSVG
jgi:hypothetical protein